MTTRLQLPAAEVVHPDGTRWPKVSVDSRNARVVLRDMAGTVVLDEPIDAVQQGPNGPASFTIALAAGGQLTVTRRSGCGCGG